jgi:hypothetical protein
MKFLLAILLLSVWGSPCRVAAASNPSTALQVSDNLPLESIARALEAYPPDWSNGEPRANIFASLDKIVSVQVKKGWTEAERARLKPIRDFYRQRVDMGLDKLEKARVAHGVQVFKFYSSSYVLKSSAGTVAMDFCQGPVNNAGEPEVRDEEQSGFYWTPVQRDRLARLVDVSIITHGHHDHSDYSLSKRLLAQGKIVIGPSQLKTLWKDLAPKLTSPEFGQVQTFGPIQMYTLLGSQYSQNQPASEGSKERMGVPGQDPSKRDYETVVYLFRIGGIVFLQGGENHVPGEAWLKQGVALGFKPNVRLSLGQFQGERSLSTLLKDMKPMFHLPLHEYELKHDGGGNRLGHLLQGNNRRTFDEHHSMPMAWGEEFLLTREMVAFTE